MLTGRHQQGFSLTELMIASALGLIVMSGIAFVLFEVAKTAQQALMQAHLRQTLTTVVALISGELRRAGYSRHPVANGDANGFLPVYVPETTPPASCILYSHDQDDNASDSSPDAGDQGGLRLSNGALQIKTSDHACGNTTCTACNSGHWLAVTDPATVQITHLRFTEAHQTLATGEGDEGIEVRKIRISLVGNLAHDPLIQHSIETVIRLPNDRAW